MASSIGQVSDVYDMDERWDAVLLGEALRMDQIRRPSAPVPGERDPPPPGRLFT